MMLTEISPIHLRGIFGTCNQFGVVVGMLVAWVVGMPELAIDAKEGFQIDAELMTLSTNQIYAF